jgi:ribosomal protein L11 methyltransferase
LKWVELSVQAPPEFVEPLSQIFLRYGHGGVAVEESGGYNPDEGETPPQALRVTVKTYIPLDPTTEERRNRIDLGVRLVAHLGPITSLQERVLEEEDWENAWKVHFHVLHVGNRIVVVPTWRDYQPNESDVVIELDPGMAFGTGHHPTTRMCLELLEELVSPGVDVLDIGCGSGILSIAAAKLGARSVYGLEIDPAAAAVAASNVRENGVAHSVKIGQGSLPHPDVARKSYDVAVANISSKVISEAAGELAAVVRPSGTLIVSGVLLDNQDVVKRALVAVGCVLERTIEDGDWVSLVASV